METPDASNWNKEAKTSQRNNSLRWVARGFRWLLFLSTTGAIVGLIGWAYSTYSNTGALEETLTHTLERRTLDDTVVERGTIESQNTVYGQCELPGSESNITFIVPEGTFVKKDEVIVRLESAKIDQQIAQKKLVLAEAEGKLKEAQQSLISKKNEGNGKIVTARRELEIARIEVEKYRDGDSKADEAELLRLIADGQAQLQKILDERSNIEILVKKGYRSPEQLDEYRLRVNSLTKAVERDRQKLENLKKYDFKLKLTTFQGKATDAELKLEREISTAQAEVDKAEVAIASASNVVELHKSELGELEDALKKCEMRAPQDGTVAYANQPWFDASQRIKNGMRVFRQQEIYYLPDMKNMQVKLGLHESVINRVKTGQTVSIRLDAFADRKLTGKVSYVAELAASSFSDTKNYEAIVLIDSLPTEIALKPGMTAEVEVLVGTYNDILAVPVGAVTEHFQQSYVYLQKGNTFTRRAVKVGRVTQSFVEIVEGLTENDVVAMDAYQRGTQDFGAAERKQQGGAGGTAAPASTDGTSASE